MNNEHRVLGCAPADALETVPHSRIAQCADCGRGIMIAPTGQRFMRKYPGARVVCIFCAHKLMKAAARAGEPIRRELAGTFDEIRNEIHSAIPNLWRKRN